jgi:two-component sensor histidine kinase
VNSMLEIYDDASGARVKIDGPDLFLEQRTGLGLALILHEMATNATKYGALSNDFGHVELRWELLNHRVRLQWAERDGPTLEQPSRKGLGTRLIRDALRDTGADTNLSFPPTGAVLDLEIPLINVQ